MRTARARATALLVVAALTLLASGCGAGGFGTKEPELDTSISKYVALGDGWAAAPYVGSTTAKDGCLRSSENYPTQVAALLGVNEFVDVSCVGTGTKALTQNTKSVISKKPLKAQIKAIDRDTELITLGTGLEDSDMIGSIFKVCLTFPPCGDRIAVKDFQKQLDNFGESLTAAVRDIQDIAPKAYIVLVGYPTLIPAQDPCDALPKVSAPELDAAYVVLQKINGAIQSAAQQTGAIYVNVASISANHHACSDDPWVSGGKTVPGKQRAFHPLAVEQKAVATEIAARVRAR